MTNLSQLQSRDSPIPVVELHIQHDGSKYKSGLQKYRLGVLLVATQQRHLSIASLFHWDLFDVDDELNFVGLRKKRKICFVSTNRH